MSGARDRFLLPALDPWPTASAEASRGQLQDLAGRRVGFDQYGLYVFDYGAPTGFRLAIRTECLRGRSQ